MAENEIWEDKRMEELSGKYERLKQKIGSYGKAAVAFSGGVDSTFLLQAAQDALGGNVLAVTASSCSFPARELKEAEEFCRRKGIRHIMVHSEELEIPGFADNPPDRCYLCKKELFQKMLAMTKEQGISYILEGSNLDDNGDYRPGLQAVAELGIQSPLRECGFTKQDIRDMSQRLGLPTWNKQSFACLASRFVYGEKITEEKLSMVDRAEQLLLDMGFGQVRVRIHGKMARIEVRPEQFEKVITEKNRLEIIRKFKEFGFSYISLDLAGYRTGSMNETL